MAEKKKKVEQYKLLINELGDYCKNQWVPIPLSSFVTEVEKIEMINENVEPLMIKIYFGNTTYDKEYNYLYVTGSKKY